MKHKDRDRVDDMVRVWCPVSDRVRVMVMVLIGS